MAARARPAAARARPGAARARPAATPRGGPRRAAARGATDAPALPAPSALDTLYAFARGGAPWEVMRILAREGYGERGVARISLGPFGDYVFLLSPESVREAVVSKADAFPERYSVELFTTLGLDRGIVYAQGAAHRANKVACVPSFESPVSMNAFVVAIQAEAAEAEARLAGRVREGGGVARRQDVYAEARRLTLDVVLAVTFGASDSVDQSRRAELSEVIAGYLESIVATANEVPPLWRLSPALSSNYSRVAGEGGLLERLRALVLEIIEDRRKQRASGTDGGSSGRADLLGVLLDQEVPDEQILYVLFDLVIAGSDTTASTITATLFLLHAQGNERALERALEEVRAVPSLDELQLDTVLGELPYVAAACKEVLRLYPPVPFIGRRSVRDETLAGYATEEGSVACWSPYFLGRDERQWGSDPDSFRPERFLDEAAATERHPFAWLPFGAGPRGCLGTRLGVTETVLVVARMLAKFDFAFERTDRLRYSYDLTLNLTGSCLADLRECRRS